MSEIIAHSEKELKALEAADEDHKPTAKEQHVIKDMDHYGTGQIQCQLKGRH